MSKFEFIKTQMDTLHTVRRICAETMDLFVEYPVFGREEEWSNFEREIRVIIRLCEDLIQSTYEDEMFELCSNIVSKSYVFMDSLSEFNREFYNMKIDHEYRDVKEDVLNNLRQLISLTNILEFGMFSVLKLELSDR